MRLATGGRDQLIHLWDTNSFDEVAQLHGHSAYVKSLAFSPDGSMLISGSGDGTIRTWNTKLHEDYNPTVSKSVGP
jgi:WD40 repeat protein